MFLPLEMPVFGVFLARRAIVCSHGRKPVEKIGPITPEPPQGAAERFDDDEDERKWHAPTKNHISLSHPGRQDDGKQYEIFPGKDQT